MVRPQKQIVYRIDGDIAYVTLTRGQETVIDAADIPLMEGHAWHATPHGIRMGGYYACSAVCGTPLYLHRHLLQAPKGMYVDHINHDTLDNRRSNLRLCSNQENSMNRDGAYSSSKIGVRGISTHQCWSKVNGQRAKSGQLYVFRCHCVTCKIAKYFPHTDEGLEAAKAYAEAHYAAMEQAS